LFEKYNKFDEIFEDIEDELSKMDDNNDEYAVFMKHAFES